LRHLNTLLGIPDLARTDKSLNAFRTEVLPLIARYCILGWVAVLWS